MDIPVWKPVVGYEGLYEVSSAGEIKSLITGKIRKQVFNKRLGYNTIILSDHGKNRTMYVHRIVAMAFCEIPPGYDFVNHKDENKLNNSADNLEWCTKEYNNNYNGKSQRCCKSVLQIIPGTTEKTQWKSAKAAHIAGIANYKNISACCRGLRKSAGGFEWRFAE